MSVLSVKPVGITFQKKNEKKMDKVTKGIIIGGAATTTLGLGLASLTLLSAKGLKSLKGQNFAYKRDFLKEIIPSDKRCLCYSKSIRKNLENFKQPLFWFAIASVGTAIGSIIGMISHTKSKNNK